MEEFEKIVSENSSLKKELEMLKIHLSEVEATANHLVSATWRERDMKKQLADTLAELNKTKEILEEKNKRIAESINYARSIQLAINTTESEIRKYFPESFIYYVPKDVISGDFPWFFSTDKDFYLAAVDCTGHGVPGAMLSMIGNLLLNELVLLHEGIDPAELLLKLHLSIISTLKQDQPGSNSNDGMDIGMIKVDRSKGKLIFSGAHRPLIIVRNNEVLSFKGDKFPVGGIQYRNKNQYSDQVIDLLPGDTIYIFSDGIVDQIGGENRKKLMINGLVDLIVNNQIHPMSVQDQIISDFISEFKGDNKQIDDMLLIGIKI